MRTVYAEPDNDAAQETSSEADTADEKDVTSEDASNGSDEKDATSQQIKNLIFPLSAASLWMYSRVLFYMKKI